MASPPARSVSGPPTEFKEGVMPKNSRARVRKGQAHFPLTREEFNARFRARFLDPAFADKTLAIDELMDIAWNGYRTARKSPMTQKAGPEFADPKYDLSLDWLATRQSIKAAQRRHDRTQRPPAFCSFAVRHETTRPVLAKCRSLIDWLKWLGRCSWRRK
jgi:hypothetical protein